ncbi:uncharacterized protein L969DRAFT_96182 [Mixia osmundae IAM 14324]|uniref:Uncharacterized protein n=1 Tax=Mixia osmundae (strain CBS 9802 / IAM 14324 / JCM 22182 / KY 12970) TaxID=764103 RepID=G7E4T0_MIXOS|nr:uncharacterized protein L969DRAFT_96182 [Mixia osmundae IAM 14324]KEI37660.1 hypothetical protein L969DRAFT_96182 [Mixia osmundae IAM 14324]GAA97840.1 hypothetical protein E5Q_04519 [Mixia osmundae IAM 14324]
MLHARPTEHSTRCSSVRLRQDLAKSSLDGHSAGTCNIWDAWLGRFAVTHQERVHRPHLGPCSYKTLSQRQLLEQSRFCRVSNGLSGILKSLHHRENLLCASRQKGCRGGQSDFQIDAKLC